MKLPAHTIIDSRKATEYLLKLRPEDDKSAFLALAGYTSENAARLLVDLRTQILSVEAEELGPFQYGTKFRIRGILTGPNGVALRIVSIWATIEATGETRFVTLYADKP
ncbi:MAG TPA: hypothetical protein VGM54_01350 [Chthoniobacter sp.]|jgi:hypothetical protein